MENKGFEPGNPMDGYKKKTVNSSEVSVADLGSFPPSEGKTDDIKVSDIPMTKFRVIFLIFQLTVYM